MFYPGDCPTSSAIVNETIEEMQTVPWCINYPEPNAASKPAWPPALFMEEFKKDECVYTTSF